VEDPAGREVGRGDYGRRRATTPLGRNLNEADIVDAIMYFISDEGAFLTGVVFDVDGGAHIGGLPGVD
jgi:enoyl-[acyl-carrier-protein] reductase (NADH)